MKIFKNLKKDFRVFFRIDTCSVGTKVGRRFLISDENSGFVKPVFMS